jgi:hypothetical protein
MPIASWDLSVDKSKLTLCAPSINVLRYGLLLKEEGLIPVAHLAILANFGSN